MKDFKKLKKKKRLLLCFSYFSFFLSFLFFFLSLSLSLSFFLFFFLSLILYFFLSLSFFLLSFFYSLALPFPNYLSNVSIFKYIHICLHSSTHRLFLHLFSTRTFQFLPCPSLLLPPSLSTHTPKWVHVRYILIEYMNMYPQLMSAMFLWRSTRVHVHIFQIDERNVISSVQIASPESASLNSHASLHNTVNSCLPMGERAKQSHGRQNLAFYLCLRYSCFSGEIEGW